jgi:hypothetical protein
LFLFILTAGSAMPGIAAAAESTTGFVAWALDRAGEIDLRWSHMTDLGAVNAPEARDGTGTVSERSLSSERTVRGTELSHSIIASHSVMHKVTLNSPLLPISTRERNGAARGVSRLRSPAMARLSVPFSIRRPFNSSTQRKYFLRTFGESVARPRLESFGRIGKSGHRLGRGISRPTSRAARPRIL